MNYSKKICFLFPILCLIVLLAGCQNSGNGTDSVGNNESEIFQNGGHGDVDTNVSSPINGVIMEVTEYTDTSVTVRITNDMDMNIECGSDFHLNILDEETGEWRDLDTVIDNYGFTAEAYMVQKDSPYEKVINFEWLYGKLEPGRYQIAKTVVFRETGDYTSYAFKAEFIVN